MILVYQLNLSSLHMNSKPRCRLWASRLVMRRKETLKMSHLYISKQLAQVGRTWGCKTVTRSHLRVSKTLTSTLATRGRWTTSARPRRSSYLKLTVHWATRDNRDHPTMSHCRRQALTTLKPSRISILITRGRQGLSGVGYLMRSEPTRELVISRSGLKIRTRLHTKTSLSLRRMTSEESALHQPLYL